MKAYCILVVLYKMEVDKCPTIQSLLKSKEYLNDSTVVIWDNSPTPLSQETIEGLKKQLPDVSYTSTPSNTSLSVIYNTVSRQYEQYEFMVFLDQDSHFSGAYFSEINEAKKQFPDINLYVPVIKHEQTIMSPGYYYGFKGGYRKSVTTGVHSTKNMCVIASGMCVSFRYLKNGFEGFNEKLTFYGIDTFFSTQYRQDNESFYVLAAPFGHSLSLNEEEKYETKLRRFVNHKKSLKILTENAGLFVKLQCRLYVLLQTIQFKLKHQKVSNEEHS